MRSLLFIFLFTTLILSTLAADPKLIANLKNYKISSQFSHNPDVKSLHNAFHYSGESFQIAEDIYHVIHFYRSNKLALDGSDVGMILELGRCRSQGFRIYCFEELDNETKSSTVTYDLYGKSTTTQINRTTTRVGDRELLDRVRIGIYSIGPDVRVDRIITPPANLVAIVSSSGSATKISGYAPNQPITIQAVMRNVGNYPAQNFVYQDAYPPFIRVTSSTANLENNSAILRATLGPGEEKRITYMIEPTNYVTHTNTAYIAYTFEKIYQNKSAGSLTLQMNRTPYSFSFLPPLQPFTHSIFNLAFTLDNQASEKLDVNKIEVSLPPALELVQTPIGYSWDPPFLRWSGSVPYQSKQTITLPIRTSQPGSYPLTAQLQLTSWQNGIASAHTHNYSYNFTVAGNSKPLEYRFSLTPETTNAGSSIHIYFALLNKDLVLYKSVQGTLTSTAFIQNLTLLMPSIPSGENKTLIDQDQSTLKEHNKTQTHPVLLNLTYKDQQNNLYTLQTSKYITLNPPTHLVTVKRNMPAEVSQGEEFTVSVSITKDISQDLSLELHDERSPDIQLIAGTPYRAFDLTKNEKTLEAYVYRLRVPHDYIGDQFQLITQIYSKSKNLTQTDIYNVKVKKLAVNLSNLTPSNASPILALRSSSANTSLNGSFALTNPTSNSTNLTGAVQAVRAEALPQDKKGFFQSFIQFFKDLF